MKHCIACRDGNLEPISSFFESPKIYLCSVCGLMTEEDEEGLAYSYVGSDWVTTPKGCLLIFKSEPDR